MKDVTKITNEDIAYFQKNLRTIRSVAGKTLENVGSWIGLTKQSISNMESHRTRMTKAQYIALRVAFEQYISSIQDTNKVMVMELLIDEHNERSL